jgi:MtN3 and saliva related transmembrane protein
MSGNLSDADFSADHSNLMGCVSMARFFFRGKGQELFCAHFQERIMNMTEIIGYFGGLCTTLAFIPQVWLVWKTKSTQDISLGMYAIYVLGVSLWLGYGIAAQAWPVLVANAATLIFASTILGLKIVNSRKDREKSVA